MTNEQIAAYIEKSLKEQGEKRAAYFRAQTDYAVALGRGTATKAMQKNVLTLRDAYEDC